MPNNCDGIAMPNGNAPTPELFARDADGKPQLATTDLDTFRYGTLIREAEEALLRLFGEGQLSGTTHTCIGQEFCQMGVVRALNHPDDIVLSNHRNHGHFLTYSGNFPGLIAEIMGREAGACGGIGGSQHLAYRGFHSNGVQGGMTAIGAGRALALRRRGSAGIVAVIIGDGTLGQGLLYESMNLASVWDAPLLVVVENNGIAQTTPTSWTIGGTIEGRARAFGLNFHRVDDASLTFFQDVDQVVQSVRNSARPAMLVIDTMRLGPHSKGDDLRDATELDAIRARDPLSRAGDRLPPTVAAEIRSQARSFIDDACRAAAASPPASHLHAQTSIFVAHEPPAPLTRVPTPRGNVRNSINTALRYLLETHGDVLLLGEDMHEPYGGAFKVTAKLSSAFAGRVISTPISEAGVVGAAIGLALAGYRPIVEIMFADFITLGFDQIVNHAVKFPGMFEDSPVPLVIRTPAGGRRGYGPTHSQSPENLLCGVPGLTVVFPSQRHQAGEILANVVERWPYPTIFLEHKLLYGTTVDSARYEAFPASPLDSGAKHFPLLRRGSTEPDVTIVAYGGMVEIAEAVAAQLAAEELEVELVLPALLAPLPRHTLTSLLLSRARVVAIEETHSECGFAAELGSVLLEAGFAGRYARVGTAPVPIPAARSLEALVMPDAKRVMDEILRLFGSE